MGPDRLTAVVDTGPLIHLAEVSYLSLLHIFDELHLPESVWREALRPPEIRKTLADAKRHDLSEEEGLEFAIAHSLENLHLGERDCLYLNLRLEVPILLTDDLSARDAAQRLGITPVGSLGIVSRACMTGHISFAEAEQILNALYGKSSLYVTRAIIDLARGQLHSALKAPPAPRGSSAHRKQE